MRRGRGERGQILAIGKTPVAQAGEVTAAAADGTTPAVAAPLGDTGMVTVIGNLLGIPAGARLRVRGRYETDPRFGQQFQLRFRNAARPAFAL